MKDMREFLDRESPNFGLKIIKFSTWHSESNNVNIDILIEKEDLSPTALEDCVKLNKIATLWLKNNNLSNRVNLSVRVPGLDRELFSVADFERFLGENVAIELREMIDNRKRIKGFIKSVKYDLITIENGSVSFEIDWNMIEKASIIPDWDEIMKKARVKKTQK